MENILEIHRNNTGKIQNPPILQMSPIIEKERENGREEISSRKPNHPVHNQNQNDIQSRNETANINLKIDNLEEKFEEKFNCLEECIHAILSASTTPNTKPKENTPIQTSYAQAVANHIPLYPNASYVAKNTPNQTIVRPRNMQQSTNPNDPRTPTIHISRQSSSLSLANGQSNEITQEAIINTFEEF